MSRDLEKRLVRLEAKGRAELAPFIARRGVQVIRTREEARAWRAQSPHTRWAEVLILGDPREVKP